MEGTGGVEGIAFPRLQNESDLALAPTVLFLQNLGHLSQLVEIGALGCGDESEHIAVGVVDDDVFVLGDLAHDLMSLFNLIVCHPFGDEQNIG